MQKKKRPFPHFIKSFTVEKRLFEPLYTFERHLLKNSGLARPRIESGDGLESGGNDVEREDERGRNVLTWSRATQQS